MLVVVNSPLMVKTFELIVKDEQAVHIKRVSFMLMF